MLKKTVISAMLLGMALVSPVMASATLDAPAVDAAISAADDARKKAASVSGEWRDTAKMIGEAKKLLEAGYLAKAMDLAHAAKRQGEAGYKQMMAQQELKMPAFLKD